MKLESAIIQSKDIDRRIHDLTHELKYLPKGRLYCEVSHGYDKWYVKTSTKTYIPKKKKDYALALAKKRFIEAEIEDLKFEKNLLDTIIKKKQKHTSAMDKLFNQKSPYHKIMSEYCQQITQYNKEWIEIRNNTPQKYPETLTHETEEKYFVRSKSERDIANSLYRNNIDYEYESKLIIDGIEFNPDFKITHPKTKRIYYWEHCGYMDKEEYRERLYNKLKIYGRQGIIPEINLILTYETKSNPLKPDDIMEIINKYFL